MPLFQAYVQVTWMVKQSLVMLLYIDYIPEFIFFIVALRQKSKAIIFMCVPKQRDGHQKI